MVQELARIHVVAGVIYNPDRDKVLIAKRPMASHQGGLWEFPGGKVFPGEEACQALCRELAEELDIVVTSASALFIEDHDYPDKKIRLDIWQVEGFTGTPRGNEGQEVSWVALDDLDAYSFPAANHSILASIRSAKAALL